jgi:hypothetical protein
MDPQANLSAQLDLAKKINKIWDMCGDNGRLDHHQLEIVAEYADHLADLVIALNEYRAKGGTIDTN